jgi:UDP-N-acetylglucosamine 4,6-dehydratase
MTRFWITLEQGVRLVMKAAERMRGGEIFVPKIPSMNLGDLGQTIAPECQVETIGIRPGEKLHEVLISEDEARHTMECEDMYIIKPTYSFWDDESWSEGTPLPDGFRYASDSNTQWLKGKELQGVANECE